jgi:hypothetical protein
MGGREKMPHLKKVAVVRGFFLPLFVFYETCVGSPLIGFVILKEVPIKDLISLAHPSNALPPPPPPPAIPNM